MMDKNNDFYKTLQVHPEAAQEIIDAAYRCLSKKYHPDINKNHMATEHMKEINIAYGVVGDSRKRRQYHYDWAKQNKTEKAKSSSFSTSTAEKQGKKENANNLKAEESAANQILNDFFAETINENWETAYQKLTKLDRANIPMGDFVEWKNAVTQIYKLGGYEISFFRRYHNCEYAGAVYPTILQFSVALKEMKVSNSQISEENTQKYVAFDGETWRVCLGYKDLKPNILKFKYLAQALPKAEKDDVFIRAIEKIDLLTGLFSLNGFIEQAEREVLRSTRYGNPLSLAVVRIESVEDQSAQEASTSLEACISYFAEAVCQKMRRTDLIGRCGETYFAIVFTETNLPGAKKALSKLLDELESDEYFNYRVYSACVAVTEDDIGGLMEDTLEKVKLREAKGSRVKQKPEDKAKLGKYKISDILGFNKKGRNHF